MIITANYRLGVMGFLGSDKLRATDGREGPMRTDVDEDDEDDE